jgi:hypothetical protein
MDTEDEYFEVVENVRSVSVDINTSKRNYTLYDTVTTTIATKEPQLYYILETVYHDAFAHWVYETAIYLHLFKFDGKIVLRNHPERTYKKLFLSLYGISEEYIVWSNSDQIPENNNICKISKSFCLNDTNRDNIPKFNVLVDSFFNSILPETITERRKEKLLNHLFLPRNKVQNYVANDRVMNYQSFYQHISGIDYLEYDTQETKDFKEQIKLLQSAKNVYLDYGSSFLVNGLFCDNSNIYITGKSDQHLLYPLLTELFTIIQKKNIVTFFPL